MQPNETAGTGGAKQVASWVHLAGFLAIIAATAAFGFYAQSRSGGAAAAGQLAEHGKVVPIYLTAGVMDWALLYYCWVGAHRRGGGWGTLTGGRWASWKDLALDFAIAAVFWPIWEGAAYAVHLLLGPDTAKSVGSLLPRSPLEILLWIAVSVTAGICEETAFRGYLQKQFHALTGSVVAAVVAQGFVFGVAHGYQGWKQVAVITVLGILYGALAALRKNLRANMIAHAWADVWEGWLKSVV
jgi:membrane protease YdiL (CAAX protease family)